jgi:hypothetical protein
MMDLNEKNKIIIAIYKNFKRVKVFRITPKLLSLIVVLNSLLIIGCVIFFLGFLFQWGKNWTIVEKNKVLEQELLLLKK